MSDFSDTLMEVIGRPVDLAVSDWFVERHGHALRHAPGLGWLAWDDQRWQPSDVQARYLAKETAAELVIAAVSAAKDAQTDMAKEAQRWSGACQEPRIRASLTLAEVHPVVAADVDAFDSDPYLLNVHNGTVDLRTGNLRPHDQGDLITMLAGGSYQPRARSERWQRFLAQTTGGDVELESYLQRAVGYTACGVTDEEVLLFAHGPGATGKTTFIEAIRAALGAYARTADFATFLASKKDGDGPTPGVARLAGARMASASEVEPGQRFNLARLKALTGGETIVARHLHKSAFEFSPRFTLWLAANERPSIPAADDATWRRVRLLPFVHVVAAADRDANLKRSLTSDPHDLAAILAWIVEGALAWQRDGLGTCAAVEAATAGYRADGDPLADWIAARCQLASGLITPGGILRSNYQDWAENSGDEVIKPHEFFAALKALGLQRKRTKRGSDWAGIGFSESPTGGSGGSGGRQNGNSPHVRAHGEEYESPATPCHPATPILAKRAA